METNNAVTMETTHTMYNRGDDCHTTNSGIHDNTMEQGFVTNNMGYTHTLVILTNTILK